MNSKFEKFIRLPELIAKIGIGKSTIYDLIKNGKFPRPVRLGRRAVAWRDSDITAWMAGCSSGPLQA